MDFKSPKPRTDIELRWLFNLFDSVRRAEFQL